MSQIANLDVLREIPGYKVILRAVIKTQIQLLLQQLADQTEEEAVILSASVKEGILTYLGSEKARGFYDGRDDVKAQFYGYLMRKLQTGNNGSQPSSYARRTSQNEEPPSKKQKIYFFMDEEESTVQTPRKSKKSQKIKNTGQCPAFKVQPSKRSKPFEKQVPCPPPLMKFSPTWLSSSVQSRNHLKPDGKNQEVTRIPSLLHHQKSSESDADKTNGQVVKTVQNTELNTPRMAESYGTAITDSGNTSDSDTVPTITSDRENISVFYGERSPISDETDTDLRTADDFRSSSVKNTTSLRSDLTITDDTGDALSVTGKQKFDTDKDSSSEKHVSKSVTSTANRLSYSIKTEIDDDKPSYNKETDELSKLANETFAAELCHAQVKVDSNKISKIPREVDNLTAMTSYVDTCHTELKDGTRMNSKISVEMDNSSTMPSVVTSPAELKDKNSINGEIPMDLDISAANTSAAPCSVGIMSSAAAPVTKTSFVAAVGDVADVKSTNISSDLALVTANINAAVNANPWADTTANITDRKNSGLDDSSCVVVKQKDNAVMDIRQQDNLEYDTTNNSHATSSGHAGAGFETAVSHSTYPDTVSVTCPTTTKPSQSTQSVIHGDTWSELVSVINSNIVDKSNDIYTAYNLMPKSPFIKTKANLEMLGVDSHTDKCPSGSLFKDDVNHGRSETVLGTLNLYENKCINSSSVNDQIHEIDITRCGHNDLSFSTTETVDVNVKHTNIDVPVASTCNLLEKNQNGTNEIPIYIQDENGNVSRYIKSRSGRNVELEHTKSLVHNPENQKCSSSSGINSLKNSATEETGESDFPKQVKTETVDSQAAEKTNSVGENIESSKGAVIVEIIESSLEEQIDDGIRELRPPDNAADGHWWENSNPNKIVGRPRGRPKKRPQKNQTDQLESSPGILSQEGTSSSYASPFVTNEQQPNYSRLCSCKNQSEGIEKYDTLNKNDLAKPADSQKIYKLSLHGKTSPECIDHQNTAKRLDSEEAVRNKKANKLKNIKLNSEDIHVEEFGDNYIPKSCILDQPVEKAVSGNDMHKSYKQVQTVNKPSSGNGGSDDNEIVTDSWPKKMCDVESTVDTLSKYSNKKNDTVHNFMPVKFPKQTENKNLFKDTDQTIELYNKNAVDTNHKGNVSEELAKESGVSDHNCFMDTDCAHEKLKLNVPQEVVTDKIMKKSDKMDIVHHGTVNNVNILVSPAVDTKENVLDETNTDSLDIKPCIIDLNNNNSEHSASATLSREPASDKPDNETITRKIKTDLINDNVPKGKRVTRESVFEELYKKSALKVFGPEFLTKYPACDSEIKIEPGEVYSVKQETNDEDLSSLNKHSIDEEQETNSGDEEKEVIKLQSDLLDNNIENSLGAPENNVCLQKKKDVRKRKRQNKSFITKVKETNHPGNKIPKRLSVKNVPGMAVFARVNEPTEVYIKPVHSKTKKTDSEKLMMLPNSRRRSSSCKEGYAGPLPEPQRNITVKRACEELKVSVECKRAGKKNKTSSKPINANEDQISLELGETANQKPVAAGLNESDRKWIQHGKSKQDNSVSNGEGVSSGCLMICNYCGKWFQYRSQLERHHLAHTGYKPYMCLVCFKRFQFKYKLQQHTAAMHPEVR